MSYQNRVNEIVIYWNTMLKTIEYLYSVVVWKQLKKKK